MKLLRVGAKGSEKPAVLDKEGKIRDIRSHVSNLNPDNLICFNRNEIPSLRG